MVVWLIVLFTLFVRWAIYKDTAETWRVIASVAKYCLTATMTLSGRVRILSFNETVVS